jgi:sugar lactone lactonase YvrE
MIPEKFSACVLASAALFSFLCACGGVNSSPGNPGNPSPIDPSTPSYAIGGSLSGLTGGTLRLLDNLQDATTLTTNGAFTFASSVSFNKPYSVTVHSNPLWQSCSVINSSGTATANVSNISVNCSSDVAVVSTLAGSTTAGSTNSTGTAASFDTPTRVAVDANGNLYVADTDNNEIREITPAGAVRTLAGSTTSGSADGAGTAASFNGPTGVAVDASGNVYVGDTQNNEIREITPAGAVTTLAGSTTRGSANGTGTTASFYFPDGLAVDASGNVYVADNDNNQIRKITPTGVVTTLAGSTTSGSADGTGTEASFHGPTCVALDASGNLYVADTQNNEIRKITPEGVVTTLAGSATAGSTDGTGTAASFFSPRGITVDASGNLYVADTSNNEIRKITPAGVVTTLAGSITAGSTDGTGTTASFSGPRGVAVDASGTLYVADTANNKIRKITPTPVQ